MTDPLDRIEAQQQAQVKRKLTSEEEYVLFLRAMYDEPYDERESQP